MKDCCHVYGVTRRGHGLSSKPSSGYDEQRLAEDIWQVLIKERIDKPVVIGHSAAGVEMTALARQHSDRLAGVVYMDALGGFAGHYARVSRQVHRSLGPIKRHNPSEREKIFVWASYEDPSRPDVIHNRIVRADDYLAINSRGGSNETQQALSILVFLFTAWELDIRPRLAKAANVELNDVASDIMGDLRIIRHATLHAKGVLAKDEHRRLRSLGAVFSPEAAIRPSYDDMHQIFVAIKQDCARLMANWLNVPTSVLDPKDLTDVAIQFPTRRP